VPIFDIVAPENIEFWLSQNAGKLDGVIHMGAISATTERDVDKIIENNFRLSILLWNTAIKFNFPFIYASSAATYGSGECGFIDSEELEDLARLRPLNPYGWSKLIFDRRVIFDVKVNNKHPSQWAGLKFFNVYGPNERHKGDMRSVINKIHPQVKAGESISLFKSHRADYRDGEQLRDFVYVRDCAKIIIWLLESGSVSGIFNVGTGTPRSFNDLVKALGGSLGKNPEIKYIDMPEAIRNSYQYFTQADNSKLKKAGYADEFYSLEAGVDDYVKTDLGL
jgi:ADP-L-glycero-D-manno-heptose 6-epimerase